MHRVSVTSTNFSTQTSDSSGKDLVTLAQEDNKMAARKSSNPVEKYVTTNRFYVEIGKDIVASFSECSSVSIDIEKQVYMEGGVNDQQRISLGQTRFSDITLKRGITDDNIFSQWMSELFAAKKTKRRNISILTYNQAGEVVKSWNLIGAIPVGWKIPSFEAAGNMVAVEELTLAFEGIKISSKAIGSGTATRDAKGFFATSSWGTTKLPFDTGLNPSSFSNRL